MKKVIIVVATDLEGGIGFEGKMPWHFPEDLTHFRNTTKHGTIIMGRKTFDSIGKALPMRQNVVITRQADWASKDVFVARSLEEAIAMSEYDQVFVIGGAEIYRQALPLADTVVVTEIAGSWKCDTFFPEVNHDEWEIVNVVKGKYCPMPHSYEFVTMERKKK